MSGRSFFPPSFWAGPLSKYLSCVLSNNNSMSIYIVVQHLYSQAKLGKQMNRRGTHDKEYYISVLSLQVFSWLLLCFIIQAVRYSGRSPPCHCPQRATVFLFVLNLFQQQWQFVAQSSNYCLASSTRGGN